MPKLEIKQMSINSWSINVSIINYSIAMKIISITKNMVDSNKWELAVWFVYTAFKPGRTIKMLWDVRLAMPLQERAMTTRMRITGYFWAAGSILVPDLSVGYTGILWENA